MTDEEAVETYLNTPGKVLKWKETYLAGVEHGRPKWISVKERLPEFNTYVLVYCPEEHEEEQVLLAYITSSSAPFRVAIDGGAIKRVTYWMLRPDKPLDGEK